MVTVPAAEPPTMPDELPTVAIAGLLLIHVPPVVEFESEIVAPAQTPVAPVIKPALGMSVMLTACVSTAVPHILVTEYDMMAVPVVTPPTMPDKIPTVATGGLLLVHVPPVAALVKEADVPGQRVVGPIIDPALGNPITVTIWVSTAVPQELVTE
jgi:hypothetical protein